MQYETGDRPQGWKRQTWLSLLVVASIAFTFELACAVPFAAISAAAVFTLHRRDAYVLAGAVWLANQAIGFAFLHYRWTWDCLAWGAVLGITALLSVLTADGVMGRLHRTWRPSAIAAAFLGAFVVYEVVLIAASLFLGGLENFTFKTQTKIFAINAIALGGLLVLDRVGVAIGIAPHARPALLMSPMRPATRRT